MSLNIKDPEAHKLAQSLAEATGETMTKAVTIALKERLSRVRRAKKARATLEEVRAIAKRFQSHLTGPVEDHGTFLYDEKGLPK
ncbi:MAG TPA: type II toxin-antitoxin system VapB family antitoxin [Candidatus Sulfotelmatobacter sp.]|jgi:antitoxin VapB|nr:type II toxin-antitoxin system VapB family antitoxin [Candidatus Sulfotelmatobacter sp.]